MTFKVLCATGLLCACVGDVTGPPRPPGPGTDPGQPPSMPVEEDPCLGTEPTPLFKGLHRLNAAEYDNSVRDLLGDASAPSSAFPADDLGYGFDNIADVLSLSPLLFEKYEAAAERLVAEAWARDGAAHADARLNTCDPAAIGADVCARQIISRFARRAWRRPVTNDEVAPLAALRTVAIAQGEGFAAGVKLALQAVLLSPNFVYRVELDAAPGAHPLSEHELATRLSYFLWSSTPDDTLLALADEGRLSEPAVLDEQLQRLLADPRSDALVDNFAEQWLFVRALNDAQPSPEVFPGFDDGLKAAMGEEARLFFRELLRSNGSALDLLGADFTFANAQLAAHYGLPAVTGAALQRVSVAGTKRGGLLTQGNLLTVTSHADRTSPVKRGQWVLGQLLCSEPPPPPPGVEALETGMVSGTVRQQMEQHRANPACATCHTSMDDIGFALENFDGVGRWRDRDRGELIDATGKLPGGKTFDGAQQLSSVLKDDPRFPRCLTRHMFIYALGRGDRAEDRCSLHRLTKELGASGNRLPALVSAIVKSPAFGQRRAEGTTP